MDHQTRDKWLMYKYGTGAVWVVRLVYWVNAEYVKHNGVSSFEELSSTRPVYQSNFNGSRKTDRNKMIIPRNRKCSWILMYCGRGRKVIAWSNADMLSTRLKWTCSQWHFIWNSKFSVKKIRFKISSAKCRPFCLGHEVLANLDMMTSPNGNIFRVTGPLRGEFTDHRWIPRTKASNAELWCFLWSAPELYINDWVNNREAGDLRRHLAHCDVSVMDHEGCDSTDNNVNNFWMVPYQLEESFQWGLFNDDH